MNIGPVGRRLLVVGLLIGHWTKQIVARLRRYVTRGTAGVFSLVGLAGQLLLPIVAYHAELIGASVGLAYVLLQFWKPRH